MQSPQSLRQVRPRHVDCVTCVGADRRALRVHAGPYQRAVSCRVRPSRRGRDLTHFTGQDARAEGWVIRVLAREPAPGSRPRPRRPRLVTRPGRPWSRLAPASSARRCSSKASRRDCLISTTTTAGFAGPTPRWQGTGKCAIGSTSTPAPRRRLWRPEQTPSAQLEAAASAVRCTSPSRASRSSATCSSWDPRRSRSASAKPRMPMSA